MEWQPLTEFCRFLRQFGKQRRVRGPSSNLTLTVARNFPFRRSSRGTERGKGRKIKKVPKLDVNAHLAKTTSFQTPIQFVPTPCYSKRISANLSLKNYNLTGIVDTATTKVCMYVDSYNSNQPVQIENRRNTLQQSEKP